MAKKRVVIVGGVAGGASCAARLRRLDEEAEILLVDRGPFVSFANCGLPYYVGNVIQDEAKLLLATPELFRQRFNIEVRVRHEAIAIHRAAQTVRVRNLETGAETDEPYDALVLSPGAEPVRPPWPGIDLPGIFTVRSVPDSQEIRAWIAQKQPKHAVVVGGGFIGLEMAENLVHRGLKVNLMGRPRQIMPLMDPEIAFYGAQTLRDKGIELHLGCEVSSFEPNAGGGLTVHATNGAVLPADLVVLAIGVKPETGLAQSAGLSIGARGGIQVDASLRTRDECIWAVGDAVEKQNVVTGAWELIPLAGPANRQGRIAAASICGRKATFRGSQATAVCGFFGITLAMTGVSEKALHAAGHQDFTVIHAHPGDHAGYYPGAKPIHLKLIFQKSDGRILGAQAAGEQGVERRIDVIAQCLQMGGTVFDLEEAELCYAPQYGSAKDPVNMAGMIAANVVRGDVEIAPWAEVESTQALIVDVREPKEFAGGSLPGAINLPLGQVRDRLGELPRDREIWVSCGVGQRAYYACRTMTLHGLKARLLSGSITTWRTIEAARQIPS